MAHARKLPEPSYKIINLEGPEHQKKFTVEVSINGQNLGTGIGNSKKAAEQEASKNALESFKQKK